MPIFTITAVQGAGGTKDIQLNPPTAFQGNELLAATISIGGTAPALLAFTPIWKPGQISGQFSVVRVSYTAAQTSGLAPGYYVLIVTLADSTMPLAYGLFEVVASPGQSPIQDFLVSPAEVMGLIPELTTVDKIGDLPRMIGSVTGFIRRYCARNFTRRTITQEYTPNYQGQVRLDEIPVNQVIRIATGRQAAMYITGPSTAQIANVRYSYTGDYDSGITVTGLILASVINAISSETPLVFAGYPTLSALAAVINTISGWKATVSSGYGNWPSSELVGGNAAQGALQGSGAQLDVYSQDAAMERLDPATGMIWLGSGYSTSFDSPAWGPDWLQFASYPRYPTRCRITYDAGFTTIPNAVVMVAIELVKSGFANLLTDPNIKSERADAYEYVLRDNIMMLSDSVKEKLAPYRIFNA